MARRLTYSRWTTDDLNLLKARYAELSAYELVATLGGRFTAQAIRSKGLALGMHKSLETKARLNKARWRCADCGSKNLAPRGGA